MGTHPIGQSYTLHQDLTALMAMDYEADSSFELLRKQTVEQLYADETAKKAEAAYQENQNMLKQLDEAEAAARAAVDPDSCMAAYEELTQALKQGWPEAEKMEPEKPGHESIEEKIKGVAEEIDTQKDAEKEKDDQKEKVDKGADSSSESVECVGPKGAKAKVNPFIKSKAMPRRRTLAPPPPPKTPRRLVPPPPPPALDAWRWMSDVPEPEEKDQPEVLGWWMDPKVNDQPEVTGWWMDLKEKDEQEGWMDATDDGVAESTSWKGEPGSRGPDVHHWGFDSNYERWAPKPYWAKRRGQKAEGHYVEGGWRDKDGQFFPRRGFTYMTRSKHTSSCPSSMHGHVYLR